MRTPLVLIVALMFLSCNPTKRGDQVEFKVNEAQNRIEVMIDGDLFTAYRYENALEKPVLYPIYAPGGIEVTRGFPIAPRELERVDHPHHLGLWLNFGDVNGFDFWNNSYAIPAERKKHYGRINHSEIIRVESQGEKGVLEVSTNWMAPDNEQVEKLLKEQTKFVFASMDGVRTIDRITTLVAVADEVVFTDNKEGMLAIRVDRAFEHPSKSPVIFSDAAGNPTEVPVLNNEGVTGWYRNSNGIEGEEAWGKKAEWVKLSGTKEGQSCSMVLMDHPSNMGYPSCWHARGYGLFSVNNMGSKVFNEANPQFELVLKKGESLTFRHRFVVSSRDLSDQEIKEIYSSFIED